LAKVGSWTAAADPVMTLGKFEDPPEEERRRRVGERSRAGTLSAWAREAPLNETAEVVRRTRNGWLAGMEQQEAQTARSLPLRDQAEQ